MANNGFEKEIEESKIEKATESIAPLDVESFKRYIKNKKSLKKEECPEILFGSYYRGNKYKTKSIRWQLLDIKENKALLLSKYALDCQRYNEQLTNVTWETCSLRKWLNTTFLDAFSTKEKALIQNTAVSADKNPKYSTDPGNDTTDKIFLLSIAEAKKYLTSNEKRKCVPTAYAISQGAYTNNEYTKGGKATCRWWLRSPGYDRRDAALVSCDGLVYYSGRYVGRGGGCVRPALWINLDSEFFLMENNGVVKNIEKSKIEKATESIAPLDVESFKRYIENKNSLKKEECPEILFGKYYRENEYEKKSIRWQVIDIKENKALLISKYALDCKRYNELYANVTWETCSLRKWMNNIFLNSAFSAKEQALIQNTTVITEKNPKNNRTNPGKVTTDKIFLLSIAEAEKYFTSDVDRKCVPTAYAIAQGAWTSNDYTKGGKATCRWWLRSPGTYQDYIAYIFDVGSVNYDGNYVYNVFDCVRPALWINLDS